VAMGWGGKSASRGGGGGGGGGRSGGVGGVGWNPLTCRQWGKKSALNRKKRSLGAGRRRGKERNEDVRLTERVSRKSERVVKTGGGASRSTGAARGGDEKERNAFAAGEKRPQKVGRSKLDREGKERQRGSAPPPGGKKKTFR